MKFTILNYLRFDSESTTLKKSFIYMIIAYLFGTIVRLILFYQATLIKGFWDSGLPVSIWTPDAGRYGFYAKSILSGIEYPLSEDYLLGYLVAGVSSLFHIDIDWVMLLLPIFIAPLIAIPIVMIGSSIKQPTVGFLAAVISVSDTFYYFRSYLGYMDTDGINLFLVLLSIAFIIKSFYTHRLFYALLSASTLLLFSIWYHSSSIIILSIVLSTLGYVAIFKHRDRASLELIFILGITILPIALLYKAILMISVALLLYILNLKTDLSYKPYLISLVILVGVGVAFLDPYHYIHRAMNYLSISPYLQFESGGITYSYPNDLRNVAEVQGVDIWSAYAPLYISVIYVIVATVGYILLLLAYPILLTTLPLMVLGYTSSWAGMRFTMFAAATLALGAIYLLYLIRKVLRDRFGSIRYIVRSPYYITILIALLMIYNIFQFNSGAIINQYFYNTEKSLLEKFGREIDDEDTIISWWDYGWPLWYYTSHDNTLTDNGYHGGPDTNIVAKLLMSRDQNFTAHAASTLGYNRIRSKKSDHRFVLPYLLEDQNYTTLLRSLKSNMYLKGNKRGENYILLHRDMLNFFAIIARDSQEDLMGHRAESYMYAWTPLMKPFSHNYSLVEGYGFILDSMTGEVVDADEKRTKINTLMITANNKREESFKFHNDSREYLIVDRGSFIWMDERYYHSFFIQAMLFDVYDKNLFEKVVETGRIKIFRIKE